MKVLVIGDFHGKFPAKLKKQIKNVDLVLCTGDFANIDKIRKYIFKYWTSKKWYEVTGLSKARKIEKECFNSGMDILKDLNSSGKKVYFIWGNADFYENFKELKKNMPKSLYPGDYNNKIRKFKNLILVDKKKRKINGLEVIGHGGYIDVTEFIKNPIDEDKKRRKERLRRYKKTEQKLKRLFSDKKPKKDFIFLIHYTPYGIFDKVKFKSSPMYGKHVGFEPYNKIIKKYRPLLVICGHMHEYQGIKKLYGVPIINPGEAGKGKAVIVELDKGRVKNIKFLR